MLLAVRILSAAALILLGPLANENPRAEPPPPPVTWLDIGGVDPVPLEQPSALLTALCRATRSSLSGNSRRGGVRGTGNPRHPGAAQRP